MKKLLIFMTMFVAAALLTISCSKDDGKDPAQVVKDLTSTDWQGEVKELKRNGRSWEDGYQTHWAVMRFKAAGTQALAGSGYQLEYRNENTIPENLTDESAFTWRIDGDIIRVIYTNQEWHSLYINYNDADIDANRFTGEMIDNEDDRYKFLFNFSKVSFRDLDEKFK
ncbi:MAG: hypothetical protein IKN02_03030 [Prevotella sp.]|jgi:hypothetical protein|nr:hypothetical protein [Prevotella sp.]